MYLNSKIRSWSTPILVGNVIDAEICVIFRRKSKATSQSFVNVLKLISFPQTIARIVKNQLPCSKVGNEINAKVWKHNNALNESTFWQDQRRYLRVCWTFCIRLECCRHLLLIDERIFNIDKNPVSYKNGLVWLHKAGSKSFLQLL